MVDPTEPDRAPASAAGEALAAPGPELPGWDERAVFAPDAALDWPGTAEPSRPPPPVASEN